MIEFTKEVKIKWSWWPDEGYDADYPHHYDDCYCTEDEARQKALDHYCDQQEDMVHNEARESEYTLAIVHDDGEDGVVLVTMPLEVRCEYHDDYTEHNLYTTREI